MRIRILQALERMFEKLSVWAEMAKQKVAVCPDCGRNRYTGKPCK